MIRFLDSSNTQIIFSCVVSQQGTFTKRKYLKTYRRPLPTRPDHARVNTERHKRIYLCMHAHQTRVHVFFYTKKINEFLFDFFKCLK